MIRLLAAAAGVLAAAGVAHLGIGGYVARRVIAPRSAKKAIAVRIADDTVTVPGVEDTRQPGAYGIWLASGAHLAVGEVLHDDGQEVVRALLADTRGAGDDSTTGVWSSQFLASPTDVGPTTVVPLELRRGATAEAWDITPPDAVEDRWTIHIHGLRSSRFGALRSTPPTVEAGWRSLVVSYAGDDECVPAEGLPSSLGTREWFDVDDALEYAVAQGAREIVLVAWSMGATIGMLALEHSRVRDRIVGLVLIGPALQWSRVIRSATAGAHLPGSVAAAAVGVLGNPVGAKALGLAEPIDVASLDWIDGDHPRATIPTLILHSRLDPVVPFSGSEDYAARTGAQLVEFTTTGHCNEPNQNPELFRASIQSWLAALSGKSKTPAM